ncbi:uncharacterized protein [Diadema setosum]|uniref:uncharacterized protein n=1 Tax=Diadema setosum TaxID=31175 RepID=UPI003B3BA063
MEQDATADSSLNGKNQHREHDDMVQETHSPLRRYSSNPSEVVIKVESGSSSWHGAGRKLSKLKPGSKRRKSSYNVRRSSLKERQKEDDLHMEILATDIADDDAKKVDVKTTAAGTDGRCLRCCMIIVIVFMIVAFLGTGGFFLVSLLSSEYYGVETERLESGNDLVSTSTSEPTPALKTTQSPSTTSPPSGTSSLSTAPITTFGSTEGAPFKHECQPGEFWCESPGDLAECVPGEWRCDGEMDCSTAADEADCGGSATPDTSLTCVTWQRTFNQSCDGCDYVPTCQPDGIQWTRLQCTLDRLTCWCVEPDSGRTVTGSFTGVDIIEDNEVLNCANFVQ